MGGAPKSLQTVTAAMKLRHLLLGRKTMTNLDSILKNRDITLLTKLATFVAEVELEYKSRKSRDTCSNKNLNAEFQRMARIDKKAFLSEQYKEIEENNRMGKTRDLFKIIRDTKGTFHAKMGSIKDGNGRDLTEAEDIKKRWQEYTEELYKKDFHDPDNHDGVITQLT